ncbi:MAG: ThiF family adenylyltransferase [Bacteroidia bacterium]|nr:ThiF family adenylyltransferase [Bacteroidia bacterium]
MQNSANTETLGYKPLIFRCQSTEDMVRYQALLELQNPTVINQISNQLEDLAGCLFPAEKLKGTNPSALVAKVLELHTLEEITNWVYFPWKNTAALVLSEKYFILCRTNRNKLKIKDPEQELLQSKSILFIGLSVGQSAAITFAMQRIGGTLHLADFDSLSLSNMNRLRASILDIGELKCTIAARQIAEQDPYLKVVCHEKGINHENIDELLTCNNTANVDLIVEECDNLEMKVLIREHARKRGIPVIMETSDKGIVDIERFDLEPNYPIFHGLIGDTKASDIPNFNKEQHFGLLAALLNYEKISTELKESYAALGREVVTWPQLAYEVTLGGATLAYAATKIMLGKNMNSGRIYVDLDSVFDNNR